MKISDGYNTAENKILIWGKNILFISLCTDLYDDNK